MNLTFKQGDLFAAPQGFYLAHCISADYALGAGIAKTFNEVYDMKFKLHLNYPTETDEFVGKALLVDNVFNLVTKYKCYHKPTYMDVGITLENMRRICNEKHIKKLAMPKIGCGLDKLEWKNVQDIIETIFYGEDIEIVIYEL